MFPEHYRVFELEECLPDRVIYEWSTSIQRVRESQLCIYEFRPLICLLTCTGHREKTDKFLVSVLRIAPKILARPEFCFELNLVNQICPFELCPHAFDDAGQLL